MCVAEMLIGSKINTYQKGYKVVRNNNKLMSVMNSITFGEYRSNLVDQFNFWSSDKNVFVGIVNTELFVHDGEVRYEIDIHELGGIVINMQNGTSVFESIADLGEDYPEPTIDYRDGRCYMTVEAARHEFYVDLYVEAYACGLYEVSAEDHEYYLRVEYRDFGARTAVDNQYTEWQEECRHYNEWCAEETERLTRINDIFMVLENEQVGSIEEAVVALVDFGIID